MEDPLNDFLDTRPYPRKQDQDSSSFTHEQKTLPYAGVALPDDLPATELTTTPYQPEEQPAPERTVTHNIGVGDSIELNSINYKILDILSGDGKTSEAVIYKVKDPKEKTFVLKLYYEFPDTHLEPNSDTLQRIRELESEELLYLYDFGTGPNKHLNKYCFEITRFAQGGDLLKVEDVSKKYTPEFIRHTVIPYIHKGLQALHTQRIYHCDLKPQNVFYLDKSQTRIVIGDYGSAKSFDITSEKELSYTTLTRGTEFYLAPEQAFGIVSDKNDYYSLGMIVLHLLYPKEVNRKNLRKIFERRTKGLPIIDFDEKYQRLNGLIEGLTLQDYNSRWGADEVERWIAGEDVPVNYGGASRLNQIEVGEVVIKTGNDLVNYVKTNKGFYHDLIDDKDGYASLLAWIRMMQGDQGVKLFDNMVAHYKRYFGSEYVKDALLFYFEPDHEIAVGAETLDILGAEKPIEQIINFFTLVDSQWKVSGFETVRLWFFRFEFALRRLRERSDNLSMVEIDQVFEKLSSTIGAIYEKDFTGMKASLFIRLENNHLPGLFHKFIPNRGFRDLLGKSYTTLFEVETFLKSNPARGKMDLLQIEKSAFIKSRSLDEFREFVEFSDNLLEFFFDRDEDFNLLAPVISRFSSAQYSTRLIESVLRFYRKSSNTIQQSVLLRLINPELPVAIGGEKIYLFNPGDFNDKIAAFFTVLESERFRISLEEISHLFFDFEFCLMQVAQNDQIKGKPMVEQVFKRLHEVIHSNYPDLINLRATFYHQIDDEKLIAILHRFNPLRVFCTHTGDYLASVEEVTMYYLQNPDQFNDEYSRYEREFFFRKSGNMRLVTLGLRDLVIDVFRAKTTFTANITEVRFDELEANEVIVYYDYEVSLDNYLHSRGLDAGIVFKSEHVNEITLKKRQLDNTEELFEKFIGKLKKRHAYGNLADSTAQSFIEAVKIARQQDFREFLILLPRYTIYLLPAAGLLFLSVAYLQDYSLFKQISFRQAPALSFIAARMVTTSASSLLFAAYFLNLVVAILLMLPLLSLLRHKNRYRRFNNDYGLLMGRTSLILLFAPVIFVGIYYVLEPVFGVQMFAPGAVMPAVSTLQFTILAYIALIFFQELYVIRAFFKVSKKIRLFPLIFSILLYMAAGYFAIIKYTLI